ncbi:MAG: hypothetical protein PVH65_12410 [Chloroflexota bacterium]|jgi:hypothetical protein
MTLSSGQDKRPQHTTSITDGKWWKREAAAAASPDRPQRGAPCPKCYMADLDWDSLFRLHCPNCGYVAECGAFT